MCDRTDGTSVPGPGHRLNGLPGERCRVWTRGRVASPGKRGRDGFKSSAGRVRIHDWRPDRPAVVAWAGKSWDPPEPGTNCRTPRLDAESSAASRHPTLVEGGERSDHRLIIRRSCGASCEVGRGSGFARSPAREVWDERQQHITWCPFLCEGGGRTCTGPLARARGGCRGGPRGHEPELTAGDLDGDQKPDGLQVNAGLRRKSLGCAHAIR